MSDQKYQLLVQKGPEPGKVYPLSSVSITIGRDPMAEITITDPEVSRQHVRLSGTLSGYKIQDLGSTNGTFIDGERLGGEAVELAVGQIITMGAGVALRFQSDLGDQDNLVTMLDGAMLASDFVVEYDEDIDDPLDRVMVEEDAPIVTELPYSGPESSMDVELTPMVEVVQSSVGEEPVPDQDLHHDQEADSQFKTESDSVSSDLTGDPVIIPHQGEVKLAGQQNSNDNGRRTPLIIVSLLLLVMCCCCSFFLFIYYYGGDWMLRQMGLLP